MEGKFVAYYRVSTKRQGSSGLGLDAQTGAVHDYLNGGRWELIAEFTEVESGKRDENRPQLQAAMHLCKITGAKLIVAKLDRLSRDAHFLMGLQKAGVPFVAADMPEANELTVGIMAVVAQAERKMISKRTKEALAAAKARGVKLGCPKGAAHLRQYGNAQAVEGRKRASAEFAANLKDVVAAIQAEGHTSLRAIGKELERRGIKARQGSTWSAVSVSALLKRLAGEPKISG